MAKEIIISKSEINKFDEMREAYAKVLSNDAHGLKGIYQKNPEALFNQITACRDTIFHIAAYKESEEVLQALVKMVPQSKKRELLKMKNLYGNTILHEVATTNKIKAADLLIRELLFSDGPLNRENDIREREEILADRNKLGETPLFRAAEYGKKMMVMYLAKEIEQVGNLQNHYKRDDGVSILHIAVIGQHFETAIWFLKKDAQLATYKDKNGKTSLHLLASMATAFKSSSPTSSMFKELIYYCLPSDSCNDQDEIDQLPLNLQSKDLEQGESSQGLHQSKRSKGIKLYCAILRRLAGGWKMLDRIWSRKIMYASAVKLAKMLVQTDASWFEPHEAEEDDIICLDRKEDEEERVKKSASNGKEYLREPDTPLFIAASTGIVEIVNEILNVYPQAVEHISKTGQNILHVATLHRKYRVFNIVKNKDKAKRLARGIDSHGCTILHHAADTKYYQGGTKPTPALKLQQELTWFENVKNQIPSHFTMHCNKENMTADQLFKNMHLEQLKTAQDWVKNTSQSCSTVAVLVATVVFTAAYTAPGGFLQNGRPILLEKPLYSFFTVMDIAGLASSLTSVVIFLSILTSSLEFEDFLHTLPRNLSLGFTFLFFSVTSTMLTFTATILLLVHLEKKWTATLTYAAAFLPICVFALFQFPLYYQYFVAAVKSIFDFLRRNLPGNWEFLQIKDDY
ncbi:uncharacterized protein LOC111275235 [Durio zibethinus]|uniref:Uncharacterized protein LOC111275235 n=1 Tax=Durio zibethinus TaxID=66656 RepID=A0A6P5WK88_DURZI|nr:uncharacterized protein LOC111275235 [Durio zibethinus]